MNDTPKINPEFKAKWVTALRSGEYQQCKSRLKKGGGYCCLGVAAVVAGYGIDEHADTVLRPGEKHNPFHAASYNALSDFGLTRDVRSPLIAMNNEGKSFAYIADVVEARF